MGLPFKPLPEKDFKKQLKDSPYCIKNNFPHRFNFYDNVMGNQVKEVIKSFVLDLKILKVNLPQEFEENNRKVIDINTKKQL